jgi:hypothetical protein
MKSIKGRPISNDVEILIYTQEFKDYDGEKSKWVWNKEIFKNGPLSVEFDDPIFTKSEKLIKELDIIEKFYISKKGDRKLRITKIDKKRIEDINLELNEFHYSLFPEDRPKIRKVRKTK